MGDFMKNSDGDFVVDLGKRYRDKINGFEGVATAHARYLTGCDRVLLEAVQNGDLKEYWFDVTRLADVEIPDDELRPGGPQSAPPSRSRL